MRDRYKQDLRQLDLQQIQRHRDDHADRAGVAENRLDGEAVPVARHDIDAERPAQHREHDDIGRAVEHALAAEHGAHERIAHEAAVGEHHRKAQTALPLRVLVAHEQNRHRRENVHRQRHEQHQPEIPQRRHIQLTLERDDQNARRNRVHHEIAHRDRTAVVDESGFAQHKAHRHNQIEHEYLLGHQQKRLCHRLSLPSCRTCGAKRLKSRSILTRLPRLSRKISAFPAAGQYGLYSPSPGFRSSPVSATGFVKLTHAEK